MLQHVAEGPEVTALVEHFDAALSRHLDVPIWQDRMDLMSGIAGAGIMLATRDAERARQLAGRVLTHLEATAIESSAGVTWRTDPQFLAPPLRTRFPTGMIDVGVAHVAHGTVSRGPHRSISVLRLRAGKRT